MNWGIESIVGENEYLIFKSLPFHPNIIPILRETTDRPPREYIDLYPPDISPWIFFAIEFWDSIKFHLRESGL